MFSANTNTAQITLLFVTHCEGSTMGYGFSLSGGTEVLIALQKTRMESKQSGEVLSRL